MSWLFVFNLQKNGSYYTVEHAQGNITITVLPLFRTADRSTQTHVYVIWRSNGYVAQLIYGTVGKEQGRTVEKFW